MSPRETIRKIVNRDPTHQVIMLAALAGGPGDAQFPAERGARLRPYSAAQEPGTVSADSDFRKSIHWRGVRGPGAVPDLVHDGLGRSRARRRRKRGHGAGGSGVVRGPADMSVDRDAANPPGHRSLEGAGPLDA